MRPGRDVCVYVLVEAVVFCYKLYTCYYVEKSFVKQLLVCALLFYVLMH